MAELPSLMTRLPGVERLLSSLSPRLAQQSKFVVEQSKAVIGRLSPRLVKQSELVVEQSQALASQSPAASDERQRTRGAGGVDVEGGRPQHLGALGGGGFLDG